VIKQPNKFKYIEYAKKSQHLPIIFSTQEMQALINATTNLKHKAIIVLMYATGIRVSEVVNLKIEDIDSKRMVIYIKDAKGGKDRIVPLPQELLTLLRKYFIEYKPKEFLFNGQFDLRYSARSINEFLKQCAKRAGISKGVHAHLVRHTSLTHSAECGIDINLIQRIAGHSDPKTTWTYLHLSHNHISKTQTPLNAISL
jgi:site-specific recombinase XerD